MPRKKHIIEICSSDEDEDAGLDDADKELEVENDGADDEEANGLIMFGRGFDKTQEYDHYLDGINPWHDNLEKPLRPSQIIGFRWMLDRHAHGGGLVADKVGTGKVTIPLECN